MLRGDSKYVRNLLAVPSYRHYIRTKRMGHARRSTTTTDSTPSCKLHLFASVYTILAISFIYYLKSKTTKYTHRWSVKLTDNYNANTNTNAKQDSLQEWLNKYPSIEPHRAHKGFTCDSWNCTPTFDIWSGHWIQPRQQYMTTDKQKYHQWLEQHNSQNMKLIDSKQQCEYIFIGDSISYSWNYHINIFNKYFNQNNNAMIYAQSGDKIHEIGWRLKDEQGDGFKKMKQCLLNGNNDIDNKSIILLIGTNDIGSGSTYNVALTDYMVLLEQFLQFINDINNNKQGINVDLYVMGIFPRGETYISFNERTANQMGTFESWNVDNKYFYSINFMNDYLEYFVDNHKNGHIKYINCNYYLFDDKFNNKNIVEIKDNNGAFHEYKMGVMSVDIMEDMLHLSEKGYERWSNCILQQTSSSRN